jgi:uncharacterized protein YkwD
MSRVALRYINFAYCGRKSASVTFKRFPAVLSLLVTLGVICVVAVNAEAASDATTHEGHSSSDMLTVSKTPQPSPDVLQSNLLQLINNERVHAGLKPLIWDNNLADAARDHAVIMSAQGSLAHQFAGEPNLLQRLTKRAVRLDAASENVVYDVTVKGAHEAFMQSQLHRLNMLSPVYDGVGIAVVNVAGVLYVVEDFAHRISVADDSEAERQVAASFNGLHLEAGLQSLNFISDDRVGAMVETMAAREAPDSHAPLTLAGAKIAASYATTNLSEIPSSVSKLAMFRNADTCTVAVKFLRTPHYPSGLFWVSIVLFGADTAHLSR